MPPAATKLKATITKAAPAAAASKKRFAPAMGILAQFAQPKQNKIPFLPMPEGEHLANLHDRFALLIKMDPLFAGGEGSHSLAIKKEGTQFALKIPVDDVFSDPHDAMLRTSLASAKTLQRGPIGNNPMAA
jgi:hypothetical protein